MRPSTAMSCCDTPDKSCASSAAASGGDERNLPTIADDLVVTKYMMAAEIVNREYQT